MAVAARRACKCLRVGAGLLFLSVVAVKGWATAGRWAWTRAVQVQVRGVGERVWDAADDNDDDGPRD